MANSIKKYVWDATHSTNSQFLAPTALSGRESTDIKVKVGKAELTNSQYQLVTSGAARYAKFNQGFTPNVGDPIRIYRQTNHTARLVDFVDGSLLTSETLDLDSNQLFNIAQEAYDKGDEATIGSESFYYSQGDAPENVAVGTLWYDTSSSTNILQVWSGTEWQATAPAKVKKTYQRVTTNGFLQVANNAHSSGKTKFADTAFKTHSSLYLNGVKLVEASTLANIPSKGDYFLSGGDVILLNLSSDTDVLVSETFDGSFSSSVFGAETNAAASAASAAASAGFAAQAAANAGAVTDAQNSATSAASSASTASGHATTAATHAANLGSVAYQDLTAIAESKAVTATDVFVYDTSKDSDGGAWRNRTQGTSWYNEALNTSTRGATKKFPAVAVIVVTNDDILIYDGDDPSLPLWMKFDGNVAGSSGTWWGTGYDNVNGNCVTMKDGLLCAGTTDTINTYQVSGLSTVSFISEKFSKYGGQSGFIYRPIAERATDFYVGTTSIVSMETADKSTNDVAITVLPNAPIDPETGLPVPTIAVATDGGVSVIKDDGTVVDTTDNTVFKGVSFVKSQYGADLYAVNTTFADDPQWYPNVGGLSDGFMFTKNFYANTPSYEKLSSDVLSRQSGNVFAPIAEHTFAVGMATSVDINLDPALNLVQHSTTLDDDGLVAYINSSHNTGWMNGDIKLATLMDTTAETINAPELVTNGDFSTDSDWTKTGNLTAISNGTATIGEASGNGAIRQEDSLIVGNTYILKFDITAVSTAASFLVFRNDHYASTTAPVISFGNSLAVTTYSRTFVATGSTVNFTAGGGNNSITIDNVSIRLAVADRSVNNNGLNIVGNVTKSAVATGAELVGYEGGSGVYLEQPYNADLNFGYGDYCVMFWAKQISGDLTAVFRGDVNAGNTGGAGAMHIWLNNSQLKTYIDGASGWINTPKGNSSFAHYVVTRRNGTVYFYQDGVLFHNYDATTRNVSRTEGTKVLSGYYPVNNILNKLALLRISATAPTEEQIAKTYRDEKPLFQEGAKCTLSSSDDVKAIAYDEDLSVLHVSNGSGSSAYRDEFVGLQNVVANQLTESSENVSACNGLVVED